MTTVTVTMVPIAMVVTAIDTIVMVAFAIVTMVMVAVAIITTVMIVTTKSLGCESIDCYDAVVIIKAKPHIRKFMENSRECWVKIGEQVMCISVYLSVFTE